MAQGLPLSAPHVLVVHADAGQRAAVASLLVAEGARVTMAAGSNEAMRHAAARRFDAAVVDLALSGTDGIVLVAQFRCLGNGRDLPAVVMHALPPGQARERAASRASHLAGVAFVAHPIDGTALAVALNGLMARA